MGTPVQPVQPGDVLLGKYTVERVLGSGGMGMVVAARHRALDELFALKVLLPHALDDREAVARFEREARAAVKLKGEHIARVTDVGRLVSGAPCMVMEYLEGQDLGEVLKARGSLSVRDAATYVRQTCEAIAEAHALGIVHRDLKPANLFLVLRRGAKPCVKVLDFGISKRRVKGETSLTQDGSFVGSPLYMSPEQMLRRRDVDARSDVWSLGVVLYQLVTGVVPFLAETMAEVVEKVVRSAVVAPGRRRPGIPASFDAVVLRCLQKDPAARFQSADALAEALEDVLRDEVAQRRQFPSMTTPLPGSGAVEAVAGKAGGAGAPERPGAGAGTSERPGAGARPGSGWPTAPSVAHGARQGEMIPPKGPAHGMARPELPKTGWRDVRGFARKTVPLPAMDLPPMAAEVPAAEVPAAEVHPGAITRGTSWGITGSHTLPSLPWGKVVALFAMGSTVITLGVAGAVLLTRGSDVAVAAPIEAPLLHKGEPKSEPKSEAVNAAQGQGKEEAPALDGSGAPEIFSAKPATASKPKPKPKSKSTPMPKSTPKGSQYDPRDL